MTGRIGGNAPFQAYGVINDGGAPGRRGGGGIHPWSWISNRPGRPRIAFDYLKAVPKE